MSRDLLREELEKDLGSKVNMMTMGTCRNWLWITVEDREQVTRKVAGAALVRLNKTGATYVVRQFFNDTGMRYLLVKSKEPAKLLTALTTDSPNHWKVRGTEKFSGTHCRAWVTEAHQPSQWLWDLNWERVPGSLHPPIWIEGSNPPLFAVKPNECQICYNEDHNT